MNKEYSAALDYLYSRLPMFSRTGAPAYKPGLETSIELSRYFGDPHKKFKSIHIGGTNGKGSTSHLIASVLQSQGYKVGLYTSPHLVDFRERIKINGEMIPEDKVVIFTEEWKNSGYNGSPSFFELTMIMAFNWFAEQKVDYAVIEVGMGGRLDSTNIITPVLSVITNISHDHNQFLGETLQEIAGEKAGIIKEVVPVVIGETQAETSETFINKAKTTHSKLVFADREKDFDIFRSHEGWKIDYNGKEITLPLGGDYQKKNIKTAVCALEQLRNLGIEISDNSIAEGIRKVVAQTGLRGRWMIMEEKPLVIADTGHNEAGLRYNFSQLEDLMKEREGGRLRIVIGFVADKAIDKIMGLLPADAIYYVTNAEIPRALSADLLIKKFEEKGLSAEKYPNVKEAFNAAKKDASEKDIIFIGGSTFIVADFLHYSCPCAGHGS